jgi:GTP cyclohydrolase IB
MMITDRDGQGTATLADVQNQADARGVAIDRVGVRDLRYPIVVLDRANGHQHTVAQISLSVALPHHFKGTHMSRFLEVLNDHRGEMTIRSLPSLLTDLQGKLEAESAQIDVAFPYFVEKSAPVTNATGIMDYDCRFLGTLTHTHLDFVVTVRVPVTSLCPCSKEISDYGAHNQRGHIDISVRTEIDDNGRPEVVWIEEIVQWAESCASAPVYPVLKRPDERHVTMQAFDHPAFVEDIVRDTALRLAAEERISWFRVEVINQESIHNHNAFAEVEWTRPDSLLPSDE